MNENEIRRYAGLMKELGLTGLEITANNQVVRLERTVSEIVAAPAAAPAAVPAAPALAEPGADSVRSPLVGVFYAAPAENAAPYVAKGDRVHKGQALCIVEAMKMLNEITAEEDGVIEDICVTNGQVVEFGTELFRLRR